MKLMIDLEEIDMQKEEARKKLIEESLPDLYPEEGDEEDE